MSDPIAAIFADTHIDTEPWTGRAIHGDSMFAFEYIISYADGRSIKKLIGAGDLVDVRRPSSEVVDFMREQLRGVYSSGTKLFYIQGQHELADPPWLSAVNPDCTEWVHKKTFIIEDYRFYGIDWTPADRLEDELTAIDGGADILVCHQVWEEFMGDITSPEGSLTQVPHVSTVITGDYHKYQVLRPDSSKMRGAANQKLTVWSPGATCLRKIDEPDEHYMLVMYADGTIKRKQIPSRSVKRVVILNALDLEKFISKWKKFNIEPDPALPERLRTPLLHVTYPEDMPEVRSRIEEVYGNLAHLFWKAKCQETDEAIQRRAAGRELRQKGPAGCLSLVVPERDPRHAPLLRLINSEDAKAELSTMKKERGL